MNSIGSRIFQAREAAGLTQEELGRLCNTTKQTIYKYESGIITNIPMDRIISISNALGVNPCSIMGWDDSEQCRSAAQPPPLSRDESDLLHKYRALDETGKLRVRATVDLEYSLRPGRAADPVPKEA